MDADQIQLDRAAVEGKVRRDLYASAYGNRLMARLRALVARALPGRYHRGGYTADDALCDGLELRTRHMPATMDWCASAAAAIVRRYAKRIHIQRDGYYSELATDPAYQYEDEFPTSRYVLRSTPRWAAVAYPGEGYEGNPWLKGTGRSPWAAYLDRVNKLMESERLPEETREAVRRHLTHQRARRTLDAAKRRRTESPKDVVVQLGPTE